MNRSYCRQVSSSTSRSGWHSRVLRLVFDTAALPRRKTTPILAGLRAGLLLLLSFCLSASAAPQTAWVARHNFDQPANSNQVMAMTLDNSGNIILAGTSANANGDFDYSILKYSPTGAQQWAVTYNSGPLADDQLRAMTVDSNGNVYVTGTSKTVKYNSSGSLQWDAPYGGRALAVDSNEFLCVVGFQEQDFATVKLAPQGTNVWLRTFDYNRGQDIAQAVAVGPAGEVYVGGTATWHCDRIGCYVGLVVVKYDAAGNRLWTGDGVFPCGLVYPGSELKGLVVLEGDRIYWGGNFQGLCSADYVAGQFDSAGARVWSFASGASGIGMTSMAVKPSGDLYMAWQSRKFCRCPFQNYRSQQQRSVALAIRFWLSKHVS